MYSRLFRLRFLVPFHSGNKQDISSSLSWRKNHEKTKSCAWQYSRGRLGECAYETRLVLHQPELRLWVWCLWGRGTVCSGSQSSMRRFGWIVRVRQDSLSTAKLWVRRQLNVWSAFTLTSTNHRSLQIIAYALWIIWLVRGIYCRQHFKSSSSRDKPSVTYKVDGTRSSDVSVNNVIEMNTTTEAVKSSNRMFEIRLDRVCAILENPNWNLYVSAASLSSR